MFKRDIEIELLKWKKSSIRKVLILRGARQVGKTSVVRKFGIEHFHDLVEVNLEDKEQRYMLEGVMSIEDFVQRVELRWGKKIQDGKTLLFIDEVQESKEILELLRFFAEQRPNLHVVAAGSLLEAKMAGKWKVPVGRVEYMYLYPLTFFEYCQAVGQGQWRDYLEKLSFGDKIVGKNILEKLFREYMTVGGMPEVVANYAIEKDSLTVGEIHSRLQNAYLEDINKYAKDAEKKYLEVAMTTAPKLAGGLYKYANLGESGYRSREMREAVGKLEQVMLLSQVKALNTIQLPLLPKEKRARKMIYLDIGLVNYANKIMFSFVSGQYRGKTMEQMVGQSLLSLGMREKVDLYYWARNKSEGSAEVDFIVQYGEKVIAIEVKSGKTKQMRSMFSLLNFSHHNYQQTDAKIVPVRVGWGDMEVEEYTYNKKRYKVLLLPVYLLSRWKELVGWF